MVFCFWKVELVTDELGYLAEEISKQSMEGQAWFLLAACKEVQEESGNLRKALLSKKELENLGTFVKFSACPYGKR